MNMIDHIVEEVRQIREEHAAQFNYDVDAIFAEFRRLQAASGQPRVSFGPRRLVKQPMPSAPASATPQK